MTRHIPCRSCSVVLLHGRESLDYHDVTQQSSLIFRVTEGMKVSHYVTLTALALTSSTYSDRDPAFVVYY